MKATGPIEELIYESCLTMDAMDFDAFMDLCDDSYEYTITAYSPEIRKAMTWLHHDKPGLDTLFKTLPKHNSDENPLSRHCTVYKIEERGAEAHVTSGVMVFKTFLDGGETQLWAVGKYYDRVKIDGDELKLLFREVRLDTRMLDIGNHVPV